MNKQPSILLKPICWLRTAWYNIQGAFNGSLHIAFWSGHLMRDAEIIEKAEVTVGYCTVCGKRDITWKRLV